MSIPSTATRWKVSLSIQQGNEMEYCSTRAITGIERRVGLRLRMCVTEDSHLLKGLQRSMISRAPFGTRAIVSVEGWTHFYRGTYELSGSHSSILGLRGLTLVSLVENDATTTTSNGASGTTPLASGDPLAGIPSFGGAQASLKASWGAPSKAG